MTIDAAVFAQSSTQEFALDKFWSLSGAVAEAWAKAQANIKIEIIKIKIYIYT